MLLKDREGPIMTRSVTASNGTVISAEIFSFFPREPKPQTKRRYLWRQRPDGSKINPFTSPSNRKASVYIRDGVFSPQTRALITSKVAGVKNSRPIGELGSPSPNSKKPKSMFTPEKTRLSRRVDFGDFSIYLEDKDLSDATQVTINTILQNVAEREFSFFVTPKQIEAASRDIRTSQQSVTGWKASDAAKASQLILNATQKMHWMHLIAYFMKGKKSQSKENLVVGTSCANYRHLLLELEVPYLLQFFPDGLEVSGKVLSDGNGVAKSMEYKLTTDDFVLNFTLDTLSQIRPNKIEGEIIHQIVSAIVERNEEKKIQSFADRLTSESSDLVRS